MKTVSSLNRALSKRSKDAARDSKVKSKGDHKNSFLSINQSTSFQNCMNSDDENEDELDERIGSVQN